MAGDVRCSKQIASHARPRNVRYSKPRHGGHFNGDVVEWDLTSEETEGYLARREEFIAEARAQKAEWEAIAVMEKPQGVR
jgi:hypothetical protein